MALFERDGYVFEVKVRSEERSRCLEGEERGEV